MVSAAYYVATQRQRFFLWQQKSQKHCMWYVFYNNLAVGRNSLKAYSNSPPAIHYILKFIIPVINIANWNETFIKIKETIDELNDTLQ